MRTFARTALGMCIALWQAPPLTAAAECSQYAQNGLTPGMTSKQVWSLMGGKGQPSEREQSSISRYVTDTATIEVEYDGVITPRENPRITRVETRFAERVVSYPELVRSLLERLGQPTEGFSDHADHPAGPVRWIDEGCGIEATASRHVPEWWEPGEGPTVLVEVRSRVRAPDFPLPRAAPAPAEEVVTSRPLSPVAAAGIPATEPVPLTVTAATLSDPDFQAPVARYNPLPKFPKATRDLGGIVQLEVLIDEKGRVEEIAVSTSTGSTLLQQAAERAVKRWRYDPATRDGVPVSVWTIVSIDFGSDSR